MYSNWVTKEAALLSPVPVSMYIVFGLAQLTTIPDIPMEGMVSVRHFQV